MHRRESSNRKMRRVEGMNVNDEIHVRIFVLYVQYVVLQSVTASGASLRRYYPGQVMRVRTKVQSQQTLP